MSYTGSKNGIVSDPPTQIPTLGYARQRGNPEVRIPHWYLAKLLQWHSNHFIFNSLLISESVGLQPQL